MAYLDDIIIFSPTLDEQTKHIQKVFGHFRQHDLKLKLPKCKFIQDQKQYLGFVISEDGIMADPEKVRVIKELSPPTTVKEIRSFIGMCSYYLRFIPNLSEVTKLLIKWTKQFTKFEWTKKHQAPSELLIELLTTAIEIAYQDINKPYILYTDTSHWCTGACLAQIHNDDYKNLTGEPCEKPIYYMSHKLTISHTNWPTI